MVEIYYLFREILIINIKCSSLLKPTEKKQSELGTKIENLTNDAMKYVKKHEEIIH